MCDYRRIGLEYIGRARSIIKSYNLLDVSQEALLENKGGVFDHYVEANVMYYSGIRNIMVAECHDRHIQCSGMDVDQLYELLRVEGVKDDEFWLNFLPHWKTIYNPTALRIPTYKMYSGIDSMVRKLCGATANNYLSPSIT